MLPRFELTEAECQTLQELSAHHPFADSRRRALGLLALHKGHSPNTVSDILGVSIPSPYNWLKAWHSKGLMGVLSGHQGGAPQKLTPEQLDAAEQIARTSPYSLSEIDRQLRERYPDLPDFSLTSLGRHLKKRGLSFTRTRLSLKKNATLNSSKTHKTN